MEDRVPIVLITLKDSHHICSSLYFVKTQLIRAGNNFLNKVIHKALHSGANTSHLYWEAVVCLIIKLDCTFLAHILSAAGSSPVAGLSCCDCSKDARSPACLMPHFLLYV